MDQKVVDRRERKLLVEEVVGQPEGCLRSRVGHGGECAPVASPVHGGTEDRDARAGGGRG